MPRQGNTATSLVDTSSSSLAPTSLAGCAFASASPLLAVVCHRLRAAAFASLLLALSFLIQGATATTTAPRLSTNSTDAGGVGVYHKTAPTSPFVYALIAVAGAITLAATMASVWTIQRLKRQGQDHQCGSLTQAGDNSQYAISARAMAQKHSAMARKVPPTKADNSSSRSSSHNIPAPGAALHARNLAGPRLSLRRNSYANASRHNVTHGGSRDAGSPKKPLRVYKRRHGAAAVTEDRNGRAASSDESASRHSAKLPKLSSQQRQTCGSGGGGSNTANSLTFSTAAQSPCTTSSEAMTHSRESSGSSPPGKDPSTTVPCLQAPGIKQSSHQLAAFVRNSSWIPVPSLKPLDSPTPLQLSPQGRSCGSWGMGSGADDERDDGDGLSGGRQEDHRVFEAQTTSMLQQQQQQQQQQQLQQRLPPPPAYDHPAYTYETFRAIFAQHQRNHGNSQTRTFHTTAERLYAERLQCLSNTKISAATRAPGRSLPHTTTPPPPPPPVRMRQRADPSEKAPATPTHHADGSSSITDNNDDHAYENSSGWNTGTVVGPHGARAVLGKVPALDDSDATDGRVPPVAPNQNNAGGCRHAAFVRSTPTFAAFPDITATVTALRPTATRRLQASPTPTMARMYGVTGWRRVTSSVHRHAAAGCDNTVSHTGRYFVPYRHRLQKLERDMTAHGTPHVRTWYALFDKIQKWADGMFEAMEDEEGMLLPASNPTTFAADMATVGGPPSKECNATYPKISTTVTTAVVGEAVARPPAPMRLPATPLPPLPHQPPAPRPFTTAARRSLQCDA